MPASLKMRNLWCLWFVVSGFCGVLPAETLKDQFDAFDYNRRIGQAVNLGNALEAPNEGEWGLTLESWHLERIAQAGFDSVRVPIKWSGHARPTAPYTIEPSFFERVDWVIDQANKNGLAAIINVHHYDEIHADIEAHEDRLAGLWRQIAQRYREVPTTELYFEIMNEPHGDFTHRRWRSVMEQSLSVIRESNPDRMVIIGGIDWNSVSGLGSLRLPEDDRHLIGTFHYYTPFRFTHQGAEWVDDSKAWLGTSWNGTPAEVQAIEDEFEALQRWSERYQRPVLLGEFGAYSKADLASRARWTAAVARAAEERDFSWSYWEFGAGFGVMQRGTRQWVPPLLQALSPQSLMNLDGLPGLNTGDADLLSQAIRDGSTDPTWDVNGDKKINVADLDYWVYFSGHNWGDANLDGQVDFVDFQQLSRNFGAQQATWSDGDFNADGQVTFDDFLRFSASFSVTADNVQSVPEPRLSYVVSFASWFVLRSQLSKPRARSSRKRQRLECPALGWKWSAIEAPRTAKN